MAITIDKLKSLAEGQKLRYFLAPDRPALLVGFGGTTGVFQVLMHIEVDGRFLQFRTLGYAKCPADHPHVEAVLRVIGALDYKLRLTKFGWDPTDGEIVAYADLWLEDATLTQRQFGAMLAAFLPGIDEGYGRIARTIESGVDPEGSGGPGVATSQGTGMGGMPPTPGPITV